ncbi:MAG: DUF2808 domain-containing protein [Cyanobacteria bacterium]|jgi:hypothetical protein|nr:DUF2808 domain-containing protein [Cyanobacteria bacterium GSL.Bin1]
MPVPSIASGLLVCGTVLLLAPASWAGERLDGTVFFDAPPRLEEAKTTFNETQMRGATYYFTLTLPSQAGEPLGKIMIEQRGGVDDIPLRLDQSTAFVGTASDKQEPIALADVSQSENNRQITVQLETPVTPGTTFTIGLQPRKNPRYGGAYLFGITAFPAGDTVQELYLGVRRIQFYDRSNDSNFPMRTR